MMFQTEVLSLSGYPQSLCPILVENMKNKVVCCVHLQGAPSGQGCCLGRARSLPVCFSHLSCRSFRDTHTLSRKGLLLRFLILTEKSSFRALTHAHTHTQLGSTSYRTDSDLF